MPNGVFAVYAGNRNFGLALYYVFRNIDAMHTVKDFIDAIGGTVRVADALQLPVSTVSGWNVNNSIPKWRRAALVDLAEKKGVPVPDFADLAA